MEPKPEPQTIKLSDEQIQKIVDLVINALLRRAADSLSREVVKSIKLGAVPEFYGL